MPCFTLNILHILLCIKLCCGVDIYELTDYCGKTIISAAGELKFDAQDLPNYLSRDTCSVQIEVESALFNSKTYVLFYFTNFHIKKLCKDANVTIIEGTPDRGTQVEGLPQFMCGHEEGLENADSVFITKGDKLTVTFKRADYLRRFHGMFSLKYVQFSTGACDGKDVHKCSNGRCIPNLKNDCFTDIACGENHTDCSNKNKGPSASELVIEGVLGFVGLLVIVIIAKICRRR